MLCVFIVEGMSVVVNVMLSLMSVMSTPPALCNLSVRTAVKLGEVILNSYIEEITAYLNDNSLLISAPKSSVTLITPDTHQAKTHPSILIKDSHLPPVK